MSTVTVGDLRNHGNDVIDRVARGERVTVTRAGKPVAELRPLASARFSSAALLERWRHLPRVDPARFRADVDGMLDSSF